MRNGVEMAGMSLGLSLGLGLSRSSAGGDTVTITDVTQSTGGSIYTNGRCRVYGTTTASDGTVVTVTVDGESAGTGTAASGSWYVDFLVTAAMVPAAGSGNPATVEASIPAGASDTTTVDVTTEAVNVLGWWDPSESAYVSLDGSGNINGITDRSSAGNDLTWDAGTGASTGVPTTTINGLTACDWSDAGDGRGLENLYVTLTMYISCVGRYDGALPFLDYKQMVGAANTPPSNDRHFLMGLSGSSRWYTGGGHTHYRDGTATTAVDNSFHFYESSDSTANRGGCVIGGDSLNDARTWDGPTGEVLALDAVPSSNYQEAELDYAQTKWGTP
jgi:hypothetical protein